MFNKMIIIKIPLTDGEIFSEAIVNNFTGKIPHKRLMNSDRLIFTYLVRFDSFCPTWSFYFRSATLP